MNLLSIQDTLKNASDQQLMQLMRSPDSSAPSYLVVSELNRRKEMRAKQAQPPRRTVAEDLTSEESQQAPMGIRSLQTAEPEDESQLADEGDGIHAMREGGVIRMAAGTPERLPVFRPLTAPTESTDPMSVAEDDLQRLFRADPTARRNEALINQTAVQYGVSPEALRQRVLRATPAASSFGSDPSFSDPRALTAPPPAAVAPAARPGSSFAPEIFQSQSAPAASSGTTPPPGRPDSGIRTLTPSAAPAAATPEGLPTLQQNMERNLGMFPGIPQELLDRIKSSRTNEGDRRREAQNMALLEAGLRIAGSNNPRLAGAISEGAVPAVQTYNQQVRQIREDQNADLTRDLSVAQADLQRRYAAGQISASELDRQSRMLISNNEIAARMRVAQMQAANAGRNPQLELLQAIRRDPKLAETHARINGRDPETRAESRLASQVTAVNGSVNALTRILSDPSGTLTDAQRAEYTAELAQLTQTLRSLRSRMGGGLGGNLGPPGEDTVRLYQLPGR